MARFDGWTIALFALLTLAFGFNSVAGVLMGLAMGGVAFVELRAAGRLQRLEAGAARTLGLNQLLLATVLSIYALWSIRQVMAGHDGLAEAIAAEPQLSELLNGDTLGDVKSIVRQVMLLVYGGLIAVAVLGQGGLAMYYFSREKRLRDHLSRTPPWIVSMQKTGVGM